MMPDSLFLYKDKYNAEITFLNPQQNVYKKWDFKACEARESGVY